MPINYHLVPGFLVAPLFLLAAEGPPNLCCNDATAVDFPPLVLPAAVVVVVVEPSLDVGE